MPSRLRFWSAFALVFNVLVVAWGAFVRASGSGAGCGSHWPLCNGVVMPVNPTWHTVVEFGHRITSGGSLVLAVAVATFGVLEYPKRHRVRRAALATLAFTLSEALIGAGLVLFGLVAQDRSPLRAISVSLHLGNTFLLIAALALTALWTREISDPRPAPRLAEPGPSRALAFASLGAVLILGLTGALTALGDTLFPAASLAQGVASDFGAAAHFLLRLRVIHPALALATAALLFRFAEDCAPRRAQALRGLVVGQLALGLVNLLLLAPTGLQILHLIVAETLWIALVWAAAPVIFHVRSRPFANATLRHLSTS